MAPIEGRTVFPHAEREAYYPRPHAAHNRPHAPREDRDHQEMNTSPSLLPFQLFDDQADVQIIERRLPHWSQAGAVPFITWRTLDSMPAAVLDKWHASRGEWLRQNGINPKDPDWRNRLQSLEPSLVREFLTSFWNRWHDDLDSGHGACVLRNPELAKIVADSLHHFDGVRYLMFDFVVITNHVHILAAFPNEESMLAQCESWKHFTATRINRQLDLRGRFWQQDGFDHLVRTERQFLYLCDYIATNPMRAGLRQGQYIHYSKLLQGRR